MRTFLLLLPLFLTTSSCTAVREFLDDDPHPISQADYDNVELYLELAEAEMAEGRLHKALDRLIAVRDLPNLPPESRVVSESLLDRCTDALLVSSDADLDALEELLDRGLSQRMGARIGVRLAERLYEEGYRVSAWKCIRDLEEDYPNHTEGAAAGAILARVGLDLIQDPGRYWIVLSYRARGISALEFLVQTYPLDPSCPLAYAKLAETYDAEGEIDLAIERTEDLVLYHKGTPEAVRAEILIPHLRLKRLERTDYDRGQMVLALAEVEGWLRRYPDDPLVDWARSVESAAHGVLCDSDLHLAHYYDRVGNPFGARLHAARALTEAQAARDEGRMATARAALAEIEGTSGLAPAAVDSGGANPVETEPVAPPEIEGAGS